MLTAVVLLEGKPSSLSQFSHRLHPTSLSLTKKASPDHDVATSTFDIGDGAFRVMCTELLFLQTFFIFSSIGLIRQEHLFPHVLHVVPLRCLHGIPRNGFLLSILPLRLHLCSV